MKKYKVIFMYSDGTKEDIDEIFDTEREAISFAEDGCLSYREGAEILNLSNPGDYPLLEDDELEYRIEEIEY